MTYMMGRRGPGRRCAVALGVFALVGAGSSSSKAPSTPSSGATGSLTVMITAPTGATPKVTVSGPGRYRQSLTATRTLSGLAVGSYTVIAAPVVVPNAIVGTVYDATVTGGAATVSAGATATASVRYAPRPGSGALWVVNAGASASLVAYTAAQLAASSDASSAVALALTGELLLQRVAFDDRGNLWIPLPSETNPGAIVEFAASELVASGRPTPAVTLSGTGGAQRGRTGLAFDAGGNLWVADFASNTVVEFAASQLTANGSPTAAVTLSATPEGSVNRPVALAFDAGGNLWVANTFSSSTVVEFAARQLTTSGSPTPAVTLSPDTTGESLTGALGLAFDARGNLWVANSLNGTIVEFARNQLAKSGSPTPAVTLITPGGSMFQLGGLAFDASGNLWVAGYPREYGKANTVAKFAASQLVTSGTPTPKVIVSGSSLAPVGLAFDPPPATLPLTQGGGKPGPKRGR